jgi:hypothetical protein
MRPNQRAAISAARDAWTAQAFSACAAAARDLITGETPPINPSLKLERLADSEWGWFVTTIVSTWVRTRSEQATAETWDHERASHTTLLDPDPWVRGAVAATLPRLAEACADLDWDKPASEWAKDDVVAFLIAGFNLITHALAARDAAENPPGATGADPDVLGRKLNAAAGNSLMTIDELRELSWRMRSAAG